MAVARYKAGEIAAIGDTVSVYSHDARRVVTGTMEQVWVTNGLVRLAGKPVGKRIDCIEVRIQDCDLVGRLPIAERKPVERPPTPGMSQTSLGSEIDPDAIEFGKAMDVYKRENRRPFPTWSEVLEVVRGLGYVKEQAEKETT